MNGAVDMTFVTLAMASVSMLLAILALLPQLKNWLTVVRDGTLWVAFVAVIGFVVFVAARQFMDTSSAAGKQPADAASHSPPTSAPP